MNPFLALILALLISPVSGLWAQATLTNEDIPKLVKSGLSEDFLLNLIDQQGSKVSSDVPNLIELKNNGVRNGLALGTALRIGGALKATRHSGDQTGTRDDPFGSVQLPGY